MKLEDAVNNALNDLDLTQSKCFIELMAALYENLEVRGEVENVYMAIGEFVPTGVGR